jgi:hypothetical protein
MFTTVVSYCEEILHVGTYLGSRIEMRIEGKYMMRNFKIYTFVVLTVYFDQCVVHVAWIAEAVKTYRKLVRKLGKGPMRRVKQR